MHGTGPGWGQTTPGGLGVQGKSAESQRWKQREALERPELGACKPSLDPRGSPTGGLQTSTRPEGVPQLGAYKSAPDPRGSPSCGPGAPLAASQPPSALWSRLHISGLPSREDESEGLYVAVSMQNQGLHTTARKASGRDNKGISCLVSTGTWQAHHPAQLL